jgi:hypothetical protein
MSLLKQIANPTNLDLKTLKKAYLKEIKSVGCIWHKR